MKNLKRSCNFSSLVYDNWQIKLLDKTWAENIFFFFSDPTEIKYHFKLYFKQLNKLTVTLHREEFVIYAPFGRSFEDEICFMTKMYMHWLYFFFGVPPSLFWEKRKHFKYHYYIIKFRKKNTHPTLIFQAPKIWLILDEFSPFSKYV